MIVTKVTTTTKEDLMRQLRASKAKSATIIDPASNDAASVKKEIDKAFKAGKAFTVVIVQ